MRRAGQFRRPPEAGRRGDDRWVGDHGAGDSGAGHGGTNQRYAGERGGVPHAAGNIWAHSLAWLLSAVFVFSSSLPTMQGALPAGVSPAAAVPDIITSAVVLGADRPGDDDLNTAISGAADPGTDLPGASFAAEPGGADGAAPVPAVTLSPQGPGWRATPFQPDTPLPTQAPAPQNEQTPEPEPGPGLNFYGLDFSRVDIPVRLKITPPRKVNGGSPIVIKIFPGPTCAYEDHRACLNAYQAPGSAAVIFATVHSGLRGEAEDFRQSVEGMGLNGAAWPLQRVMANLQALAGSPVTLVQGDLTVEGFTLAVAERVPPGQMQAYFSASPEQALAQAAQAAPALQPFVQPAQPQLVFETCGWQHPEEAWAPGVTSSTGSVYLGVIQKTQVK